MIRQAFMRIFANVIMTFFMGTGMVMTSQTITDPLYHVVFWIISVLSFIYVFVKIMDDVKEDIEIIGKRKA